MPRVALVTCNVLPEPDVDREITQSALQEIGLEATWEAWDDENVDWSKFGLAILRSTWNYYRHVSHFQDWLRDVEQQTRLLNSRQIVRANLHKKYLIELAEKEVRVVPTLLISRGIGNFSDVPWPKFVLKPAISASSFRTQIFDISRLPEAFEFADMILSESDLLVQEYMPSVENGGEVAWIWIDGELTHGVRKQPRLHDEDESVSQAIFPSEGDLLRLKPFADQIPNGSLYARIDVMEHLGDWLLSEMELIEPSLYLLQNPVAAVKFAEAVAKDTGF
jgi:hypothetical protein